MPTFFRQTSEQTNSGVNGAVPDCAFAVEGALGVGWVQVDQSRNAGHQSSVGRRAVQVVVEFQAQELKKNNFRWASSARVKL